MDTNSEISFKSEKYIRLDKSVVKYSYRTIETKNNNADVEVNINGKIYRTQINMISNELDKTYLDGFVESIINPC
jgi:hypothetical protein